MSFPCYAEVKDSGVEWLGEVPAHWCVLPLLGVACERYESNSGMVESNLLSLSYGRIVKKDIDSNDGLLPESFETYQVVWPNDIVFRLTDLQNDKRSLRTAIVTQKGIITSAYLAVTPKLAGARYMHYLLRACDERKVFYSMGGGLRQSMKYSDVKRLGLPVPSMEEQTAIVAFLDRETAKIDGLVAEQEMLIALLKEKRRAVISHAVTKGLNPDTPMKESGIEWLGEVPAHWDVSRLKFVARIQTGVAKGKDNTGKDTLSVPYLRVANVQDGYLDLEDIATIDIPSDDLERYTLRPGDVLMNEGGDFDKLGRGHVWSGEIDPCIHQNHVFAVRPVAVSSALLSWVTSSDYAQFYFMGRSKQSTNLASISSSNIMELPIVVPPVEEQRAIEARLDDETGQIGELAREAEIAIALLKERRSALISAAVTGKIDVRRIPIPDSADAVSICA